MSTSEAKRTQFQSHSVGVFGSPLGASLYCICPTPRGAFEQARCPFLQYRRGKLVAGIVAALQIVDAFRAR